MKKNDNRHYNRQTQRDLGLEMDLWCFVVGKNLQSENPTLKINGRIPRGKVVEFSLERVSGQNLRGRIRFESGVCLTVPIKNRKLTQVLLIHEKDI